MTVQLPARNAFPDEENPGRIAPALAHYDQHVDDIAESQNWAAAYFGRMHASQAFPVGLAGAPYADTTERHVLTYLVIPRMHMTTLEWRMRYETTVAAANVTIRLECVENGETDTVVSAGIVANRYETGTLEIMREDQLSTIKVYLTAASGTVQMESFAIWDEDLAAADLHFDYYADTAAAVADGMARYWALQEDDDAGVDATAVDVLGSGDDMTANNGVTIDSAKINADRQYHRVFGASDYLEGAFIYDSGTDFTWLLEIQANEDTNDHTFIATGADRVSVAGDTATVQLEVNGVIDTWAAALPFTEVKCLFIVHDVSATTVTLYEADGAGTVTQRAQRAASPTSDGTSIRIGRGYLGDASHQDTEYLDDGLVRSCATWEDKALSLMEMNAVARHLRVRGAQIVR